MLRTSMKLACLGLLTALTWATLHDTSDGQLFPRLRRNACCYDPCAGRWGGGYHGGHSYGYGYGHATYYHTHYNTNPCCASTVYLQRTPIVVQQPVMGSQGVTGQAARDGYRADEQDQIEGTRTRQPEQTDPIYHRSPGDRSTGNDDEIDNSLDASRQWQDKPAWSEPKIASGDDSDSPETTRATSDLAIYQDEADRSQARQDFDRQQATRQGEQSNPSGLSEFLASKLALCNKALIECAEKASGMAQHPDVKAFADTIVQEHSAMQRKLSPHVAAYASPMLTQADPGRAIANADAARDEQADQARDGDRNQQADSTQKQRTLIETDYRLSQDRCYSDLYAVLQKAQQHMKQAADEMLANAPKGEFDMTYVGSQIMTHQMLVAELQAIEETSADAELQQLAKEFRGKVEQHLVRAKELAKQLK